MPENEIGLKLQAIKLGMVQMNRDFESLDRKLFDKDEGCIPELRRSVQSLKDWQLRLMGGAGALVVVAKVLHFL